LVRCSPKLQRKTRLSRRFWA